MIIVTNNARIGNKIYFFYLMSRFTQLNQKSLGTRDFSTNLFYLVYDSRVSSNFLQPSSTMVVVKFVCCTTCLKVQMYTYSTYMPQNELVRIKLDKQLSSARFKFINSLPWDVDILYNQDGTEAFFNSNLAFVAFLQDGLDNGLSNIWNENRSLINPFAISPQTNAVIVASIKGSIIANKAVFVAIYIGWPEYDRAREFFTNSLLALPFACVKFRGPCKSHPKKTPT